MSLLSSATLLAPAGGERFVSVKDFGATGDGATDDTTAINNALAASSAVYFPSGSYKVSSALTITTGALLWGNGINSEIQYTGTSTLFSLSSVQDITFTGLSIYLTAAGATAISMSGCFLCQLDRVRIRGQHTDKTVSTYQGQIGLSLSSNTGNTRIHTSHFANLGVGVKTSCIQNEITNSRFTNCYESVWGTGNSGTAGLVLVACEFIGTSSTPYSTLQHVWIDGSANSWVFTGCWFEGTDYALVVGDSTNGGPSSMTLSACKVAARTTGIIWNYCRQPSVIGCEFNADSGGTMTEMTFPGAGLNYEGIGFNNITTLRSDFADSDYPQYWNVARRGQFRVPNFTSSSNLTVAGTTSTGNLAVTNSVTNGYILTSDSSGNATWGAPSQTPTATKTSAYTAAAGDLVICSASGGAFTVTLPNAPSTPALPRITIVKTDTSTNAVTIAAAGSDVINVSGTTSVKLVNYLAAAVLVYKGGVWTNQEASTPAHFSYVAQTGTRATGYGDLPEGVYVPQAMELQAVQFRIGTADASGTSAAQIYTNTTNASTGSALSGASVSSAGWNVANTHTIVSGPWSIAAGTWLQCNVTSVGTTPGARLTVDFIGVWL
ncbi:glycosyl hydrolase family 28-related protein [Nocardia sp. NPDC088792]|uniref:glycosyl hydrolase family 28-related protein n=1 Tax=Nocardia sp. NPDC088792 TaxID=3364332 RepID=UPI0038200547